MSHIALVEDDRVTAASVKFVLTGMGHDVEHFEDGAEALHKLQAAPPDLLVLDLVLPGLDGLEICRRLRSSYPHLPIIMLTARGEEVERVVGLEFGADDYVTKPFSLRELEARVKAVLRRSSATAGVPRRSRLSAGPFALDLGGGLLELNGRTVALAPREAEVLGILLRHAGEIVSRDDLLEEVWGKDYLGESKTLDVHIRWLRMKVEQDPGNPRYIKTVRGRGFRLETG